MPRCPWAKTERAAAYHDTEWGVPSFDDQHLFEHLALECAQAGLSWETVLGKRARYQQVFHRFDITRVARMTEKDIASLLLDPGIIRNRQKIVATVKNANILARLGSFSDYLWGFVDGKPVVNRWRTSTDVPAITQLSEKISADMRKRGFAFAGPTGIYALMQSVGIVNDHLVTCRRWREVGRDGGSR